MSKDEIRKLVSGYATGTLTEAEHTLLFEAALDDQELFDELAREQDLRDVLDQPGAKQRLIAALEPAALEPANVAGESRAPASSEKIVWWKRGWSWAAAGVAATVLMLLFLTGPNPEPPQPAGSGQPTEVAQNRVPSPETGQQPAPPPPGVASPASPAPPENPARQKKSQVDSASSGSAGVSAGGAVGGSIRSDASDAASGTPAPAAAPAPNVARVSPVPTPAPPPAPAPAAPSVTSSASPVAPAQESSAQNAPAAGAFVANSNAPVPAQRAMKSMAPMAARAPGNAMAKPQSPARFAFDYRIESGRLTIQPAANGYLHVAAATPQGATPIFPESGDGQIRSGVPVSIDIPDAATNLEILFTARPVEPSQVPTTSDALAPDARPSSGTVEDPNPSSDSRIQIRVRVKP